MTITQSKNRPVSLPRLQQMKQNGEKISCLTAYDASFAHWVDAAGVEMILVGDSLGMVVQGHTSTLPVSIDEMIYHCKAVRRGAPQAWVIADMPFMSFYEASLGLAVAARLMAEGMANMVKLEGAGEVIGLTQRMVENGIPVCAHLGLTPQSVNQLGGYRVQGRSNEAAQKMLDDALALEQAGASLLVLECVPQLLAREISSQLNIPTIGIGAGPHCDGQVLVCYDIVGLTTAYLPSFVRDFSAGQVNIKAAMEAFVAAVRSGDFPGQDESFGDAAVHNG